MKCPVYRVNMLLGKNVRRKLEKHCIAGELAVGAKRDVRTSTNNDKYDCTNSPLREGRCLLPFLAIRHLDCWSAFPNIIHKCVVLHFNIMGSAWLYKVEGCEVSTRGIIRE